MAHEISIYYGALCPDSQRLIVTQIQPAIQRLPRYILDQIRLVPSGKSECCSLFQLDFYTIDACATGKEGDWLLAGYVKEAEALFPTVRRLNTYHCFVRTRGSGESMRTEKESEDEEKSKSPAETLNYGKDSKN
ncbi:unnamed protein product [Cyprideis torosa]|uniref:Uncharacterized protein n=1 Tax=Cyprideis torosa TaxID=163714 RepID=A0A7R8WJ94_9CRUS|nr:unnamed protein product [Cyprideis torosa]CAG0901683.1 unnamed protein product [Cyprideis torosa]